MIKSINSIIACLITAFVIIITTIISSISIYTINSSKEVSLNIFKNEVYSNNKDMIIYETQIATNIAQQYYNKELSGELTREQAMAKAASTIRNIRYGNSGYFFIYDVEGNTIALLGSDLEKSNRMNVTSSDGNFYVKQIIDNARNKPSGEFTNIKINKPYGNGEEDKIVFSKLFTPYNWIIGTGIYTNDLEEEILKANKENILYYEKICLLLIFISIILCISSYFIAKKVSSIISKPLLHITDRMTRISSGNLNKNKDDEFSDEIFSGSLNEFAKLNKASNILSNNIGAIVTFISKSVENIFNISKNLNIISKTSKKCIENINRTINSSYKKYEYEIDTISSLHIMVQKDKEELSNLKNNLTNIHNAMHRYCDSINIIKETINNIYIGISNNKDRNINTTFLIKEVTSDYDRINSNINLISNLLFQTNVYITKIMDSIGKKDYDITSDINAIKDLISRNQENLNNTHSILIGTTRGFKNINDSINSEMDTLSSSGKFLDNTLVILDNGLETSNTACKDIYNTINKMNDIVYNLDIQYTGLEELNNKFKAINKDIQMIVNYSDNVHDNMNKISLFITELGDIINKINEKLIMKIKK